MPKIKNKTQRLLILDALLRNVHRKYDLETLLSACNQELEFLAEEPISKRTLQSDLFDMEYDFDVEFNEDLRHKRPAIYQYADPNKKYDFHNIVNKDAQKIQSAINVLADYQGIPQYDWARMVLKAALLHIENNGIECVEFENNPDLRGVEMFTDILGAIVNRQPLQITYQSFHGESHDYKLSPYLLKQYNGRWFLLCQTKEFPSLSCFPLDRIKSFTQIVEDFDLPRTDLSELFADRIGVSAINQELPIEDVVIRVTNERYPYLETKPIHDTQTRISDRSDDKHTVIRLRVIINNELEQQLLSFGSDIEVLEPDSLRKRMKGNIEAMIKRYQ